MIMENNNNAQEQVFISLRRDNAPQRAIHIGWDDLFDTFSELLTKILGRKIIAEVARDGYYHWLIGFLDTPLTRDELITLIELANDGGIDIEQNDIGEAPITESCEEICEDLCNKLMNRLLPYKIISIRADDDGVWFIGEEIADRSELKPLTQEQIAECLRLQRPLYHFVPGDPDGSGWITLSTEDPYDWDYGKVDGYGTEYIAYDREPDTMWPFRSM